MEPKIVLAMIVIALCILIHPIKHHKIDPHFKPLMRVSDIKKSLFDIPVKDDKKVAVIQSQGSGDVSLKISRGGNQFEYHIPYEDYQILIRMVEAEATGGNLEQKKNVAQCIINRLKEPGNYPCTLKDIIFMHRGKVWQFSPLSDKRYYKVEITKETIQAVNEVLENPHVHNATYFKTYNCDSSFFRNHLKFLFEDGIHKYYIEK